MGQDISRNQLFSSRCLCYLTFTRLAQNLCNKLGVLKPNESALNAVKHEKSAPTKCSYMHSKLYAFFSSSFFRLNDKLYALAASLVIQELHATHGRSVSIHTYIYIYGSRWTNNKYHSKTNVRITSTPVVIWLMNLSWHVFLLKNYLINLFILFIALFLGMVTWINRKLSTAGLYRQAPPKKQTLNNKSRGHPPNPATYGQRQQKNFLTCKKKF